VLRGHLPRSRRLLSFIAAFSMTIPLGTPALSQPVRTGLDPSLHAPGQWSMLKKLVNVPKKEIDEKQREWETREGRPERVRPKKN
jgi:hypothetical protein